MMGGCSSCRVSVGPFWPDGLGGVLCRTCLDRITEGQTQPDPRRPVTVILEQSLSYLNNRELVQLGREIQKRIPAEV